MEPLTVDTLTDLVGRSAILGTAAMGLVEASKFTRLGVAGFRKIRESLGEAGMKALAQAYGANALDAVLKGSFRSGHLELGEVLRNGLRLGLTGANASGLAAEFGQDANRLTAALTSAKGADPGADDEAVSALARFHAAIDARVNAAIASAHETYLGTLRVAATVVAMAGSFLVAFLTGQSTLLALVVGFVAVPITPISKELLNFLRAAGEAVRGLGR